MKIPHYAKTYLVHGFNVKDDGEDTIARLMPYLQCNINHMCFKFLYGWLGLVGVLIKNKNIAKNLAAQVSADGSIHITAVGHSNGCAIIIESARQGAIYDTVVLINPALKTKTVFPPSIKEIWVIHTKYDKATKAARFFNRIPFIGWFVPNAWGAMGTQGYCGEDDVRVINIDGSKDLKSHSDIFEYNNLKKYGPAIKRYLLV